MRIFSDIVRGHKNFFKKLGFIKDFNKKLEFIKSKNHFIDILKNPMSSLKISLLFGS
jgi:hypothetical protein